MPHKLLVLLAASTLVACATGPHPAVQIASEDLACEQSGLKVHEIYAKKVRVEGCGKEATYVDACSGYGVESECGWSRYYATAFERDAAKRAKAERKEAEAQQAEDKEAEAKRAEQEEAERATAEQEKAEQEKVAKAEQEKAEQEKVAKADPEKTDEKKTDDDEVKAKAEAEKPKAKNAKRAKKSEGIEDFLK